MNAFGRIKRRRARHILTYLTNNCVQINYLQTSLYTDGTHNDMQSDPNPLHRVHHTQTNLTLIRINKRLTEVSYHIQKSATYKNRIIQKAQNQLISKISTQEYNYFYFRTTLLVYFYNPRFARTPKTKGELVVSWGGKKE